MFQVVGEREAEARTFQEQLSKLQGELARLRQELQERATQEEQLRQQMAEKEEKTKKVILGAKQKISQLVGEWRPLRSVPILLPQPPLVSAGRRQEGCLFLVQVPRSSC